MLHMLTPEVLGDTLTVSPNGTINAPLLMRFRLRLPAVHHSLPGVMLEHVLSSHTLLGMGAPLGCWGLGKGTDCDEAVCCAVCVAPQTVGPPKKGDSGSLLLKYTTYPDVIVNNPARIPAAVPSPIQ